jgi:hypothetical protein
MMTFEKRSFGNDPFTCVSRFALHEVSAFFTDDSCADRVASPVDRNRAVVQMTTSMVRV